MFRPVFHYLPDIILFWGLLLGFVTMLHIRKQGPSGLAAMGLASGIALVLCGFQLASTFNWGLPIW